MNEKKNFPQIEEEIMKQWERDHIFERSVENRDQKSAYVFYDGPPFATGLPHYGHLVASTMKDIVPRYWTMNGRRVERRWGWDCHGLPIENIVEKEMNLNGRKDIEDFGIGKFNEACESKIGLYATEWKTTINRFGRWVDMDNDYKTMDLDFMESVWWVFKSLYEKKLAYLGHKSMHICPRCETTLSNIEVSQGYSDVTDLSVTAKFELVDEPGTYVLAWTTTPWTLPGNVALAVGGDIEYVKVEFESNFYIVAKELAAVVFEGKDFQIVSEFMGVELENRKYKPLFNYFIDKDLPNKENLYKIVTADFVSTKDGTGVVHLAPAFGEDDLTIGKEKKLSFIQHVGQDGRFTADVTDWAGEEVKPKEDPMATDLKVLKKLAATNLLFAKAKYTHSYPHCWRCDSPLLNYAADSWFINVTKLKPRVLELAEQINWVPAHLKDGRFGQWLDGARDWSISRSRFWGNPMPIWQCDHCDELVVLGSKEELEKLSGQSVTDLHKHHVDQITFACQCGGLMKRIPEVFDCWFESGSMPYGQMHYPFENKEKFEANFPAEFIAEGVDQTRAWFYVLHVLSVALFDKPAYKNVVANGIVLAEDGQKMSKRKSNYPDPMAVINKYGADALRYYLVSSPVMRAEDFCFSEKGVDEVYKKVILMTLNILSFYQMFAGSEVKEVKSNHILDRWIMTKTDELVNIVTESMNAYDFPRAAKPIGDFIGELSTWYIRRSRDRFKHGSDDDKQAAIYTLNQVLTRLSLVMAPFMPFMAEHLWSNLGHKDSIHLQNWPEGSKDKVDASLLAAMTMARDLVVLGLSVRDEAAIKVRQPLQAFEYTGAALDAELELIVAEELNVQTVNHVDAVSEVGGWHVKETPTIKVSLKVELTPELRLSGHLRELIRFVNNLRKNAGLTINDRVVLYYQTDSADLKSVFSDKSLVAELQQSVAADTVETARGEVELNFQSDLKVNGEEIWIGLKKI